MFSPNHRTCFLQIAEHVFSKSPNTFSPNRQRISPHVSPNRQRFFSKSPRYFADQRAAHVPLYALWRRPSLRSLPTRATGSALYVMGGWLRSFGHTYFSYMYMGSALNVMDYGTTKAKKINIGYIARTPLVLPLSPSSYNSCRPEHVQRYFLWKRLSRQFYPTRATSSALYVMGGRLRFLGHVCYSYTCTGSALDVMDYRLAKAIGTSSRPTGRMLIELRIIASGLKPRRLFRRTTSKLHILQTPYDKYLISTCFLRYRVF